MTGAELPIVCLSAAVFERVVHPLYIRNVDPSRTLLPRARDSRSASSAALSDPFARA